MFVEGKTYHAHLVLAEEETVWVSPQAYIFRCRAKTNPQTGTLDMDILLETPEEKARYAEFEHATKVEGKQYYLDIPELEEL